MTQDNIIPHHQTVSPLERIHLKGHRPAVVWFTGLSGSGKSTIANLVEARLCRDFHAHTFLLDGDNIRTGLNKDLGFTPRDRAENIRRLGEVCRLFYDAGLIVLTAFISPYAADRNRIRERIPEGDFIEVFVQCPLDVCESRDPKGLYQKARNGQIQNFTGIGSDYEIPVNPELTLYSGLLSADECAEEVIKFLTVHQLRARKDTKEIDG